MIPAAEMLMAERRQVREHLDTCRLFRISIRSRGVYVVVEDNALIRQFLEAAIKSAGRDVAMFNNAADAQEYIEEQGPGRITCCVVDVGVRDGSGESFVAWIEQKYYEIPIVVYTQHATRAQSIKDKYPAIGCLVKANGNGNGELERIKHLLAISK